jgi:hypothetical protein
LTDEQPFGGAIDQVNSAQREQEHPPVELVDRLVADDKVVAQQHFIAAVVQDASTDRWFGARAA